MVKVKLQFNYNSLNMENKIKANVPAAKRAVLNKMLEDTEPYLPYKTGKLSDSGSVDLEGEQLVYDVDYAGYAFKPTYRGKKKVYDTSKHPLAQGYPYKASAKDNKAEWLHLFKEKLMEGINDGNN